MHFTGFVRDLDFNMELWNSLSVNGVYIAIVLSVNLSPHFVNISQTVRTFSIFICIRLSFRMRIELMIPHIVLVHQKLWRGFSGEWVGVRRGSISKLSLFLWLNLGWNENFRKGLFFFPCERGGWGGREGGNLRIVIIFIDCTTFL